MANIKSAKKRIKVSRKATERNRSAKSELNTEIKKFKAAVAAKEKDNATARLTTVMSLVDQAAQDSIMHKNKANRLKARFSKMVAEAFAAS